MKEHLDEHTIELYVLNPSMLESDLRRRVAEHLGRCVGCADLEQRFRSFYADVEKELEKPPSERVSALAAALLSGRRRSLPERSLVRQSKEIRENLDRFSAQSSRRPYPLTRRIAHLIRLYPIRIGAVAAVGIAGIFAFVFLFKPGSTSNPTFLSVERGVMSVYGENGELLWKKAVAGIPDGRSDMPVNIGRVEKRYFLLADIDGDGKNVILLSGPTDPSLKSSFATDTLYCFEGDGSLRWRAGAGSLAVFGDHTYASRQLFIDWTTVKRRNHPPKLFAVVRDYAYSPSKMMELDTQTGYELSAYHNRGHADKLFVTDLTRDGNEELLWGGINDGFNKAFLAVLDAASVSGYAPVPEHFQPVKHQPGSELFFILFPQSRVGKALSTVPYNAVAAITPCASGGVSVNVEDFSVPGDPSLSGSILYSFTSTMSCNNSIPGDGWLGTAQRAPKSLGLSLLHEVEIIQTFKDSLLYWDGSRFVHTSTPSRHRLSPPHIGG